MEYLVPTSTKGMSAEASPLFSFGRCFFVGCGVWSVVSDCRFWGSSFGQEVSSRCLGFPPKNINLVISLVLGVFLSLIVPIAPCQLTGWPCAGSPLGTHAKTWAKRSKP